MRHPEPARVAQPPRPGAVRGAAGRRPRRDGRRRGPRRWRSPPRARPSRPAATCARCATWPRRRRPQPTAGPSAIVELHQLALQAPKPLVALVDGPAYAGGFGLAGICDVVLATAAGQLRAAGGTDRAVPDDRRGAPRPLAAAQGPARDDDDRAAASVADAYRLGFVARICTAPRRCTPRRTGMPSWFADAAPDAIRLGRKAFTVLADLPAPQALDAAQLFNNN